jgi:hypothetical protein
MAKKVAEEFARFKDFLRRIIAVPKKEIEEKIEEYQARRKERSEEEPET